MKPLEKPPRKQTTSGKYSEQKKPGQSVLKESTPVYTISSRLRAIGNSQGVILSDRVIEEAGISPAAELLIEVSEGRIMITEARSGGQLNTDLGSWDMEFKKLIRPGKSGESDLWNSLPNRFDKEEWT